jgi:hypothetical protein
MYWRRGLQVPSLEYALFLKDRGYVVDPDPARPEVQQAFREGSIKSFARHSRLGRHQSGYSRTGKKGFYGFY